MHGALIVSTNFHTRRLDRDLDLLRAGGYRDGTYIRRFVERGNDFVNELADETDAAFADAEEAFR